jgi:N-acetylglutamate synthase-like GNAT family acetyltransferase
MHSLIWGDFCEPKLKFLLELCDMPNDKIHKGIKILLLDDSFVTNKTVAGCRLILSGDNKSGHIASVCVNPFLQRRGYGKKIITEVHRQFNLEYYYLSAVNTAIGFYDNLGYKQVGIKDIPKEFAKQMVRINKEYERLNLTRRIGAFMRYENTM